MMVTEVARGGIGASVKRKEDARFIRGKGNFIEDVSLPGMLHMAMVRSPYAHARIRSVNTDAATALPGVVAVVTGEMLAGFNLAWMPTLSYDTQAVLATDKVRFQGQEVAAVIATDRYIARDGADLVEVEYEPLAAIVNPHKANDPGVHVIRDDKERQTNNSLYHWESGDKDLTATGFARVQRIV